MASPSPRPSTDSGNDPAHPSQPNSDHTTSTGEKPDSAITAITDPDFLPTLDDVPPTQKAKSHLLLFSLLLGGVFSAWFMGFELFQVHENKSWLELGILLAAVVGAGGLLLIWTGSTAIDWWELVAGYWWLSLPVAGAAGLILVMAQEQATGFEEMD